MAASGSQTIQLYYSTTSGTAPVAGNLVSGEIALNITDGKLYYKDNGGTVQLLASKAAASGSFSDITASGNVTLSGGTANGVVYLNGSKVLTTGSALTFDGTNLGVGGTPTNNGASYPTFCVNGSAAGIFEWKAGGVRQAQGYATTSSLVLGSTVDIPFLFTVNNAEQMRLTSTGLGIGTSSPGAKLNVQATGIQGLFQYDASNQILVFHSGSNGYFGTYTNQPLILRTNNTDRVTIDTSGNLGLGVTPSAWGSGWTGLQVGLSGSVSNTGTGTPVTAFSNNAYYNGTSWVYINTGAAAQYQQSTSQHIWRYAASGSGNVTWSEAMRLDVSGNLGIGTSSPSFKLDVAGSSPRIRVSDASTGYAINQYSNTSGSLFVGVDDSTGGAFSQGGYTRNIYSTGAYPIVFSTNSTGRMTLDSSGNLGLGVTPSAWASDWKVMQIGSRSAFAQYNVNASAIVANNVYFAGTGGSSPTYINTAAASFEQQVNGAFNWYTAPSGTAGAAITFTQAMTLDASGRLGVGATSPNATLQVRGDNGSSVSAVVRIRDTNSTARTTRLQFEDYNGTLADGFIDFKVPTAGVGSSAILQLGVNSAAMTLDASGNLGVGTTSMSSKMHIANAGDVSYRAQNTSANTVLLAGADSTGGYVGAFSNHPVLFYTNSTERARITSSGTFLVGKTASATANTGAELQNGTGGNAASVFTADGSAATIINRLTSDGTIVDIRRSGSTVGTISVTTTATAYNTSSDYRLKNINGPLTGSGEFIDALKPKVGTWKADGSKFVGFLAHEVQEISPSSVVGEKDAVDEDGKPIMQAMEYGSAEFIANIIAELQSLRKRVAALESK